MTKTGVLNLMVKLQKGLLMLGRGKVARLTALTSLNNTTTKTKLFYMSVPANTIKAGAIIDLDLGFEIVSVNATPNMTFNLELGSTVLATLPLSVLASMGRIQARFQFTSTGSAAVGRYTISLVVTPSEGDPIAATISGATSDIPSLDTAELAVFATWSAAHSSNQAKFYTGTLALLPQ